MKIVSHSKEIEPNDFFLIMPNGKKYINEALKKNATILNHPYPQKFWGNYLKILFPKEPKYCVAITGTNGKTSTTSMVYQIWSQLGKKAASLGTLGFNGNTMNCTSSSLTTPSAQDFYNLLNKISKHITHFVFEASSHGLEQERINQTAITTACFTNLSPEHLDYHNSMEEYFASKQKLFTEMNPKNIITNIDDEYGKRIKASFTYGINNPNADLKFTSDHHILYKNKKYFFPFIIDYNKIQIYNFLAALSIVLSIDINIEDVIHRIKNFQEIPGRFEYITSSNGANIYIDFAHTPDALENILQQSRSKETNNIWVVFGCGGDRDPSKRKPMGEIASRLADYIVITDDNPRFENAQKIRNEILKGCVGKVYEYGDRKKAIHFAIDNLKENDILIVAGKGHEKKQIIKNQELEYSDKETIIEYLKTKNGARDRDRTGDL